MWRQFLTGTAIALTLTTSMLSAHAQTTEINFGVISTEASLNQKKNWVVDPLTRYSGAQASQKVGLFGSAYPLWSTAPDRPAALLVIVNTFFGWLMTTLFAAGVTGFLRRGRDT